MNKLIGAAAVGLALAFSAGAANAATFNDQFLGAGTNWAADGDTPPSYFFYFTGSADQSYAGTGLSSANSLELDVNYIRDATEDLTFTFSLNGIDIGTWLVPQSGGVDVPGSTTLSFLFGPIAANPGDSFTVAMRVTDGVCVGCGNVEFVSTDPATLRLSDEGGAIPEPATWALMILGFGAAGSMLRRRAHAIAV